MQKNKQQTFQTSAFTCFSHNCKNVSIYNPVEILYKPLKFEEFPVG